jgi:haloalkane dehalogenase
MQRRQFIRLAGVALSTTTLAACATHTAVTRDPIATPLDAVAFAAARRFASTPFGRIAYVERGRGPAALFLHGFPLNGFQWRGALERLASQRRCIAPDFLALGHTEVAPGQSVAPDAQCAMLVALLDRLGIDRADVVASDSGGAVAQLLLAQHPQRVRSLLLTNCDSAIDCPPPALLPVIELAKSGTFVDQWLGAWRADHALARSPDGIGGMCYVDPAHPTDEAIDTYFSPLLATGARKAQVHAYAIALQRNWLAEVSPALRASRTPVRIVWGLADTIFAPRGLEHLTHAFGNLQGVRRLEHDKLFWPEERPDVVAEEARRLWGLG